MHAVGAGTALCVSVRASRLELRARVMALAESTHWVMDVVLETVSRDPRTEDPLEWESLTDSNS